MIQYYQLTPEILLEYIYDGDPKLDEDGKKGNIKDLSKTPTILLNSEAFSTKYLCFKNESEGLDSITNLVLPLNNTETQFVVAKSKYQDFYSKLNASNRYLTKSGRVYIYEDTNYDKDIVSIKYDKCILHFTSRNYFGSYDSLIFQAYVYMNNRAKLYFASFLFKKTSNLELKSEHMLYNEKLYTAQVEFDIPSVFSIFYPESDDDNQKEFNNTLKSQNIELLGNTPIGINVYGVSGSTIGEDKFEKLKVNKINTISIPYIYNRLDEISVNIYEACDDKHIEDGDIYGDFYYIDPEMGPSYSSFVDYIESMGEDIRAYMVMHELSLIEVPVNSEGVPEVNKGKVTHKEYHIIDINEDDEDNDISDKFDAKIKYRPICMYADKNYKAYIEDRIKIINTVDNTSYEVSGLLEIKSKKYGKKLKTLDVSSRPIVNVYNKKVTDSSTPLGLNRSGGFVVENMTQNITSFIECTNIGVSIVELSPDDIN